MTSGVDPRDLEIERLEEVLAYENPWVTLYFDRVRFPNGREGQYVRLAFEDGGVIILPVSADGRIGMLRLYRYPIAAWGWELPRGFGEPGLTPLENAQKELLEEMGVSTDFWTHLGTMNPNSGMASGEVSVFLAANVPTDTTLDRGNGESIASISFFTPDELRRMVREGELKDIFTLAVLTLAGFNAALQ